MELDNLRKEVLAELYEEGRLTTYGLGKKLGISTSGVRNRAKDLIEEGLVEVEEDKTGKRVKNWFSLTEEGEEIGFSVWKEVNKDRLRKTRASMGSFAEVEDLLEELKHEEG